MIDFNGWFGSSERWLFVFGMEVLVKFFKSDDKDRVDNRQYLKESDFW